MNYNDDDDNGGGNGGAEKERGQRKCAEVNDNDNDNGGGLDGKKMMVIAKARTREKMERLKWNDVKEKGRRYTRGRWDRIGRRDKGKRRGKAMGSCEEREAMEEERKEGDCEGEASQVKRGRKRINYKDREREGW